MKKLCLFILFGSLISSLSSCGGGCDASTADGAAKCTCDLLSDFENAKGDNDKVAEVSERYDAFEKAVEEQIRSGAYTEEELNQAIKKLNDCK